ncbi:ATP-binding protein [Streptomyces sp. NPDC050617]|uniref:ATP-binding protein n=1 Tax=Streptomyces sp. NPDC050617 TaxID=3154628 RepID=UPI00342742B9
MEYDPYRLPFIRELVTAQMHLWGLAERVEDARLVTTELVCNVKHTGDKHFRLGMRRRPDAIVIEVRDFSPVLVVFPEAAPEAKPDAAPDTGPGAAPDTGPGAAPDTGPGASSEAEPDVAGLDLRELSEHGRGLNCVRSFADGVGVRPVPNGKIVWAKLRYR